MIRVGMTTLFIAATAAAQDPVALSMEPVDAEDTISAVTLYRGRAAITRTTTLDLEPGGWSVFFRDLPHGADRNSMQASVSGDARLMAVDTSLYEVHEMDQEIVAELNGQIEDVERSLEEANATSSGLEIQTALLQKWATAASTQNEGGMAEDRPFDLDAFGSQLAFIGQKYEVISLAYARVKVRIEELEDELRVLKQRRRNIAQTSGGTYEYRDGRRVLDAVVDVGVRTRGQVTVEITYLIANATWEPRYAIHASGDGSDVTIDYDAIITQRTGENWNDVALTLSTAQPQQSADAPMPRPWYVDVYAPPPPTAGRGGVGPAGAEARVRRMEVADAMVGTATAGVMIDMASGAAAVVGNGPVVSFAIPRELTIPSNREDTQTVSIASVDATTSLFRVAVPMLTDTVYMQSTITNESPYILLPGQAAIFHGSDFVGRTRLATVAPSETFDLGLGIDPAMTAERTLVEKNTSSTGLFGGGRRTAWEWRIAVSNGNNKPVDVRVWDRIPVSRNEEIQVSFKNTAMPLSSDPNYLSVDRPQGLLRWDFTAAADTTGTGSTVITWTVTLDRAKDIETTPLPE